jgi:hypothetical protein
MRLRAGPFGNVTQTWGLGQVKGPNIPPGAIYISRFIRTEIAPDNRVVLLQRGGGEAFCPRFRYFVFAPQFFDPLETAFYD